MAQQVPRRPPAGSQQCCGKVPGVKFKDLTVLGVISKEIVIPGLEFQELKVPGVVFKEMKVPGVTFKEMACLFAQMCRMCQKCGM